jgi:predicted MFS family arabinose efflux permease
MRFLEKLRFGRGPRDAGRSDWLTPCELKILSLVALGGALEFYDFIIFAFFAPVIGRQFFPAGTPEGLATIQALSIFGAGYIVRPLSGIVLAHCGDLFGRQRVFAFSILLMTISTLGMSLLPNYATVDIAAPFLLLLMRVLQGAAIGGEVPGALTFISEHFPLKRLGLACGTVCAGLSMGLLLGSMAATATNGLLTASQFESFGWRLPFVAGGVFGLLAVYLRRWLQETPVFAEMKRKRLLVQELPLRVIVRQYPTGIVISILLTWVLSACIVVVCILNAMVLQKYYGYTSTEALLANSFGSLVSIFAVVVAGGLIDKIGSGVLLIFGSIALGIASFVFYIYAGHSKPVLLLLCALMGIAIAIAAAVPYVMVRAFPACVRFTGVSFSFNLSYAIFGGSTPVVIAWFAQNDVMAYAYYMLFIALLAFSIGVYMWRHGEGLAHDPGLEEASSPPSLVRRGVGSP